MFAKYGMYIVFTYFCHISWIGNWIYWLPLFKGTKLVVVLWVQILPFYGNFFPIVDTIVKEKGESLLTTTIVNSPLPPSHKHIRTICLAFAISNGITTKGKTNSIVFPTEKGTCRPNSIIQNSFLTGPLASINISQLYAKISIWRTKQIFREICLRT